MYIETVFSIRILVWKIYCAVILLYTQYYMYMYLPLHSLQAAK